MRSFHSSLLATSKQNCQRSVEDISISDEKKSELLMSPVHRNIYLPANSAASLPVQSDVALTNKAVPPMTIRNEAVPMTIQSDVALVDGFPPVDSLVCVSGQIDQSLPADSKVVTPVVQSGADVGVQCNSISTIVPLILHQKQYVLNLLIAISLLNIFIVESFHSQLNCHPNF